MNSSVTEGIETKQVQLRTASPKQQPSILIKPGPPKTTLFSALVSLLTLLYSPLPLSLSPLYLLSFLHSSLATVTSLFPSSLHSGLKMPGSLTYFHIKTITSPHPLYLHPPIQSIQLTIQTNFHRGSTVTCSLWTWDYHLGDVLRVVWSKTQGEEKL